MKQVKRAYKYRLNPTSEQEMILLRSIGATRFIWNWGLNLRTKAWKERKEKISSVDLMNLLPKLKLEEETAWLSEISSVVLQQCLRDQDRAFSNFFTSIKGTRKGKKINYPRFKSRVTSKKSLRYVGDAFRFKNRELYLAKIEGSLNIVWSRSLPDGIQPSSLTISFDASGHWFVSILVEDNIEQLEPTGVKPRTVGIDLGLKDFAVFSDGTVIEHPKFLKKSEARLKQYQRMLSKTQKGSKNRTKARIKFAKQCAKVKNRRNDFNHKLSTDIINRYDVIVIEDLATSNMARNHRLAKSVYDSALRDFRTKLTYKAEWYGRELVVVSRWLPSSRTCFECKWYNSELKLSERSWTCLGCGTLLDRDLNAAKNIMAEGLSVLDKRNLVKNVCFDELGSPSESGEVRPKVEVTASTSSNVSQDALSTRYSSMNQKPSIVKELYEVA